MESKIVYFEKTGDVNTDETLRIAEQRAEELGIKSVVVASHSGKTGVKAVDVFKGRKVVVITHSVGFRGENINEFVDENRKIIEDKGGLVHTATHVFGGLSRAMRQGEIPECGQTYVVGDIAAIQHNVRLSRDVHSSCFTGLDASIAQNNVPTPLYQAANCTGPTDYTILQNNRSG